MQHETSYVGGGVGTMLLLLLPMMIYVGNSVDGQLRDCLFLFNVLLFCLRPNKHSPLFIAP
eukprot:m.14145 g.14145  ORF g.14145 m.14145 type:complete len:61 (+) comp10014_c0_seq1:96-278(+)